MLHFQLTYIKQFLVGNFSKHMKYLLRFTLFYWIKLRFHYKMEINEQELINEPHSLLSILIASTHYIVGQKLFGIQLASFQDKKQKRFEFISFYEVNLDKNQLLTYAFFDFFGILLSSSIEQFFKNNSKIWCRQKKTLFLNCTKFDI